MLKNLFKFEFNNYWRNIDKNILFGFFILFFLGLFFSFSSTSSLAGERLNKAYYFFFSKHLIFTVLALFIMFVISAIETSLLKKITVPLFIISFLLLILVPIISPFRDSRFHAKELLGNRFKEVYIQASIETLEKRDTKGLYRQQKNGLIDNLIGVSNKNPYELPKNPDLIINTDKLSLKESSERLKKFISKLI